ncbi:MAG: hypothetical protein HQL82_10605 [Magnetococcales bacterium]|nr:hypothetical protein [Magnetococcales bacterium]
MKTKALGLVSIVVLGLSVVGNALYFSLLAAQGESLQGGAGQPEKEKETALPPVPPIDSILRSKVDKVRDRLAQLRNPHQPVVGELNLESVGFSREAIQVSETAASASEENYSDRIISMAYVSDKDRFAVIDGQLYREGDEFGDTGARIRTITPEKVLIAGREIRQWVKVDNPLARAAAATPETAADIVAAAQKTVVTVAPPAPATKAPLNPLESIKGYNDMLQSLSGQ